jgi:hypothetical protein
MINNISVFNFLLWNPSSHPSYFPHCCCENINTGGSSMIVLMSCWRAPAKTHRQTHTKIEFSSLHHPDRPDPSFHFQFLQQDSTDLQWIGRRIIYQIIWQATYGWISLYLELVGTVCDEIRQMILIMCECHRK